MATDWATIHTVRRAMESGKWNTPASVGGIVEIPGQHATMQSGDGKQAQNTCCARGLVHMKRDHKWLIRLDLVQITCLAIPVVRETGLGGRSDSFVDIDISLSSPRPGGEGRNSLDLLLSSDSASLGTNLMVSLALVSQLSLDAGSWERCPF